MNNNQFQKVPQNLRRMPSAGMTYSFLALAVLLGALSGFGQSFFLSILVASVLAAVSFLSLPNLSLQKMVLTAIGCAALSLALACTSIFLTNEFRVCLLIAVSYVPCALVVALCVLRMKSRSYTVVFTSGVLVVLLFLYFLGSVYDTYGGISLSVFQSLFEEYVQYIQKVLSSLLESLSLVGTDAEQALFSSVTPEEYATQLAQYMLTLLPGILIAILMAEAYVITGLFRRIMLGFSIGRKKLSDWLVNISGTTATAYLISAALFVFSYFFSSFSDSYFITLLLVASSNLAFITMPGCFWVGGRNLLRALRSKQPQALLSVAFLLMITCCYPIMIFFYLGLSGAFSTLIYEYSNRQKRDSDDSDHPS
jgi:hypothetical protein